MEGNFNIDNTCNYALQSQQGIENVMSWNGLKKLLNLLVLCDYICI